MHTKPPTMGQRIENPCRTALLNALAVLDAHGQHGAACYVAMAIDCLGETALTDPATDGADPRNGPPADPAARRPA